MKSLMVLLQKVLSDEGTRCHVSTILDLKTAKERKEHEGLSFLTITLPNFGKDFEKSLSQGFVDNEQYPGFARTAGLPRFLGGFLCLVFSRFDGRLLDDPSIDAIHAVRQITLMFGKIALPCSIEREEAALDRYVECEKDIRSFDAALDDLDRSSFSRISEMLFSGLFTHVDQLVYEGKILPKHSKGSTADGLLGNKKYDQRSWTRRLEDYFPVGEMVFSSWGFFLENASDVDILEPGAEIPVEVILVPKTLKTPRIIGREPTAMQYMQQGLLEPITEFTDRDDFLSKLISSKSQTPNQRLAREGSISGSLATLDLSEASDRVSNQHVRLLLANHPHLAGAVDACRSRKADVRGRGIIRLAKFASMGSALCFPFEAMVFITVVFIGIQNALGRSLTRRDIKSYLGKVRIYGDDIIVPTEYAESVVRSLAAFGFKVNTGKSFWTGKFRESCGKEYYNGVDVSIVRVRQLLPTHRKDTAEIVSTVSLFNQLNQFGFSETCGWLEQIIRGLIPFPDVLATSSALGRHVSVDFTVDKMSPDLHAPLVRGAVEIPKPRANSLDGAGALMKWFLKRGDLPFADRNHLLYSGRPVSVDIKTRWVSPY